MVTFLKLFYNKIIIFLYVIISMEVAKTDQKLLNVISQLQHQKKLLNENIKRVAEQSQYNSHMVAIADDNNHMLERKNKLTERQVNALQCLNNYLSDIKKTNVNSQTIIDEINHDIRDVNTKIKQLHENIQKKQPVPALMS